MKKNGRIPSLDGLRAISIALVLAGHGFYTIPDSWRDAFSNRVGFLLPIFINSSAGVMTFFAISGFLITHLLRKEWEKTSKIDLKGFYLRRVFRIFPAFYTYGIFIVILTTVGVLSISTKTLLAALTFSLNYSVLWNHAPNSEDYWFIGHFWTISMEEQFYLLWPLTVLTLGLLKSRKAAVWIFCLSPLIRVVSYFAFPAERDQMGIMLHTYSDAIMIGCAAALYEGDEKYERFVQSLRSGLIPLLAFCFDFLISPLLDERFHGVYSAPIGISLNAICTIILVIWLTRYPSTLLGRSLNCKPIVYIGVLSYSLYLWQQIFLTGLNQTILGQFPVNLLAAFAMANLSYYCIEQPFLRLRSKLVLKT